MIARFPDYQALRDKKNAAPDTLTQADLLNMKVWFQLAWFDPRFLRGPVTLPDGQIVDLSDLVTEQADGTFTLDAPFTEATGERLVVEEFKVLANVVAAHKALMYDATTKQGQVEVMTTPFFHPILPLLTDTELAKQAMPTTPMPSKRFQQEADADAHVAKAVKRFTDDFGRAPTGMWPAEGSVAEAVVPIFARHGVRWLATDRRVLEKSTPANQPIYSPYRIDVDTVAGDGGTVDDELAIVFRDTELSDKIGFHYQGQPAAANVADYMASLRKHSPRYGEDRLLTVILDGENAWEWYKQDNDGIGFLEGMYGALTGAQTEGEVRTVTVSEYLDGNAARQVPAHPVHALPELEPLFAGSWISGSFSTWIGEDEENLAWDYLADVRADLADFAAGYGFMARPDPLAAPPPEGPTAAVVRVQGLGVDVRGRGQRLVLVVRRGPDRGRRRRAVRSDLPDPARERVPLRAARGRADPGAGPAEDPARLPPARGPAHREPDDRRSLQPGRRPRSRGRERVDERGLRRVPGRRQRHHPQPAGRDLDLVPRRDRRLGLARAPDEPGRHPAARDGLPGPRVLLAEAHRLGLPRADHPGPEAGDDPVGRPDHLLGRGRRARGDRSTSRAARRPRSWRRPMARAGALPRRRPGSRCRSPAT